MNFFRQMWTLRYRLKHKFLFTVVVRTSFPIHNDYKLWLLTYIVEASALLCVVYSVLKLEAVCFCETQVTCQITQSYNLKDTLHSCRCESLKSHPDLFFPELHFYPTLSLCADFKRCLKSEPEEWVVYNQHGKRFAYAQRILGHRWECPNLIFRAVCAWCWTCWAYKLRDENF
jgi:hypothetical protein